VTCQRGSLTDFDATGHRRRNSDAGSCARSGGRGWRWDLPSPIGTQWNGVWAASDNEAWAVGEAGLTYHYLNGTWSLVPSNTNASLYGIYGFAPDDVWAAGFHGQGIHRNGTAWTPVTVSNGGRSIRTLWGADFMHVWAGGSGASFAETAYFNGSTWKFHFTLAAGTITGIWGTAADDVWFVAAVDTLQHFSGGTMTVADLDASVQPGAGVWGATPDSYWPGGLNGQLLYFDGGVWDVATVLPSTIKTLWGTSDDDFWAVTDGGVLHFTQGGTQWVQSVPSTVQINAVHGSSASNVWAVGGQASLLHWDGGAWTAVTPAVSGVRGYLNGIAARPRAVKSAPPTATSRRAPRCRRSARRRARTPARNTNRSSNTNTPQLMGAQGGQDKRAKGMKRTLRRFLKQ
jgi:hypothetical protein